FDRGTRYNIHVDSDGLLYAGAGGVALTWMDAVVDGHVVTPRCGKPVEVNALWVNAADRRDVFRRRQTDGPRDDGACGVRARVLERIRRLLLRRRRRRFDP